MLRILKFNYLCGKHMVFCNTAYDVDGAVDMGIITATSQPRTFNSALRCCECSGDCHSVNHQPNPLNGGGE